MTDQEPTKVTRLTIARKGDRLRIIGRQTTTMIVPPSDATHGLDKKAGFWFEVRTHERECLYRRVLPNPFAEEREAPSGDPERPFTRAKVGSEEQVFVLLVPELEAGSQLVLCGSPGGIPGVRAVPIATLDLREPAAAFKALTAGAGEPNTKGPSRRPRKRRK